MSHENELIVNLSDEQQEMVAGGLDLGISLTKYDLRAANFATMSTSGPNGSTAAGVAQSVKINTSGLNIVRLG